MYTYIRFNGAVDLNPRKPDSRAAVQRANESLQWGRGFESTETLLTEIGCESVAEALQWGRGFESTETSRLLRRGSHPHRRFNGAVDLNPRKHLRRERKRCERRHASMGPWI